MSIEQAKAFIEKMKTDKAFREQIMAIETLEDRLKAIGAAGYDCTLGHIYRAETPTGYCYWWERITHGVPLR